MRDVLQTVRSYKAADVTILILRKRTSKSMPTTPLKHVVAHITHHVRKMCNNGNGDHILKAANDHIQLTILLQQQRNKQDIRALLM